MARKSKLVHRRLPSRLGRVEVLEQRMVLSLVPFAPASEQLTLSGDSLYYVTEDEHGRNGQIWRTDGTLPGTLQVTNHPAYFGPENLTDVNGTLFYSGMTVPEGVELWKTDGTPHGTRFIADVNPNNSGGPGPQDLTNIDGTLYFTGGWWSDVELWRSDGTAEGTFEVADIHPTHGAGPHNLIGFDGDVFFTANDGVHGFELWRSDGTAQGTRLVKDIHPGEIGSGAENTTDFRMTVAGSRLYFIADDGAHGKELWTSDGTTEGTRLVFDFTPGPAAQINDLAAFGDVLFFGIYGGENKGLWRTNGTSEGTFRVKELSGVWGLAMVGDSLYFSADDGVHGAELWRTLGTPETTAMVADAVPGHDGSNPASIVPASLPGGNWALFYNASDGERTTLYRSDGTAAGTVVVRHGFETSWATEIVPFNGHIYLARDGQLWRASIMNVGEPIADAGGPYMIAEGEPLFLDASETTDPDSGDILEFDWDVNADGVFTDAAGASAVLTWHQLELLGLNTAASWNVRVRVRDGNGGETISPAAPLSISLSPPKITAVHLSASHGGQFAPKFLGLGDLPGGATSSFGTAISADGNVIVGYGTTATTTEPFRWTRSTGMVGLGLPHGESLAILTGLSSDGSAAVGYSLGLPFNPTAPASLDLLTDASSYGHPLRWSAESGYALLQSPGGSYGSEIPAAISGDGTVAVGSAYWDEGYLGVRWNADGAATLIGGPSLWNGVAGGPVYVVSQQGTVIYGEGHTHSEIRGTIFRWTIESGTQALGVQGRPVAASADGSTVVANVVGYGADGGGIILVKPGQDCTPLEPPEPPTTPLLAGSVCSGTNVTALPLDEGGQYVAWDASADASVIVGGSRDGAFIWDAANGARLIADVLAEQGYLLDDWTLSAATGVSADGTIVVGYGLNARGEPEAWRADLRANVHPTVGSGEQLKPLPQMGLDQISISFSEDVVIEAHDLVVAGGNFSNYPISQFAYDSATHTAVWRLSHPIGADAVQITLASGVDGVRDLAGVTLDGEWENPVSQSDPSSDTFPSGDGAAGGDFVFRFNVLPGDVDGSGAVGRADLAMLVQQGFKRSADAGFDARCDLDGDGAIAVRDAMIARDLMGDYIPAYAGLAPEAVAASTGGRPVLRRIAASRERFASPPSPTAVDSVIASEPAESSTLRGLRQARRR